MEHTETYICPHCGNTIAKDLPYCGFCGKVNEFLQRRIQIEKALGHDVSDLLPPLSAVPQPAAATEEAAPASPSPEATAEKNKLLLRRLLIAGVSVALACLVLATALIVRQNVLGYHASPDRLAVGVLRALEKQDEALLFSLFHTDEQVSFSMAEDLHLELVDIMEGTRGKLAILMFRKEDSGNTLDGSLSAYQRDGRWYLSATDAWILMSDSYWNSSYVVY